MATPERYDVTKKLEEDSEAGTSGAGGKQPTRRCLYVLLAVSLLIMLSLVVALIVLLAIGPTTKAVPTNYYQGTQKLTNHVQPKRPEKVTKSRSKSASGVQPTTAPEKVELTVGGGQRSTEAARSTVSTTASPTPATRVTDKPAQGQGQGQARPTGRTTVTPPPSPTTTASPAQPRVTPTSARNRTAHEQTTNQTTSQTTTAPPRGRNGTGAGGKPDGEQFHTVIRKSSSTSTVHNGQPHSTTIQETVTNGQGVRRVVEIGPDGRARTRQETFTPPAGYADTAAELPSPAPHVEAARRAILESARRSIEEARRRILGFSQRAQLAFGRPIVWGP